MATLTTIPVLPTTQSRSTTFFRTVGGSAATFLLGTTALACAILGYHPFAEDGGIYAAAAALRLNPALFSAERAFAIGHTSRSLFVPLVAGTAHALHLPLPWTLLLLYLASIAVTIAAAGSLAACVFPQRRAQRWAVLVSAVALGTPAAGTSLYLCDPYLTARSITTPLLLFAVASFLRKRYALTALCLAAACAVHPIMGAWAIVFFVFLAAQTARHPTARMCCCAAAILCLMAGTSMLSGHEEAAARAAALTRDYWFLARWHWYELAGLILPPLVLLAFRRGSPAPQLRTLATACVAAVLTCSLASVLFVHANANSLLLARMQPMRILHTMYFVMFLLLGGTLARSKWQPWAFTGIAAVALFALQRDTYPNSPHFELPGSAPRNAWIQAFVWARDNTPQSALFALDAHYTAAPGEDAQLFRAVALRSQLPDAAKDGGIASVMTELAPAWQRAAEAQTGLDTATDEERLRRIAPLGATWMILPARARTALNCPYRNRAAKVCQLTR